MRASSLAAILLSLAVPGTALGQAGPERPRARAEPTGAPADDRRTVEREGGPAPSPRRGRNSIQHIRESQCGLGHKTIFVDLGNNPFRDADLTGEVRNHRASDGLRVGGNINTGDWVVGCINAENRLVDERIMSGESVRVVLLNPRPEYTYALVQDGGGLKAAEVAQRRSLDATGPICSPTAPECDRDADELDSLLKQLEGYAVEIPKTMATVQALQDVVAGVTSCAGVGWRSCKVAKAAPPATDGKVAHLEAEAKGATAETAALYAGFLLTRQRYQARTEALCAKWREKLIAFPEMETTLAGAGAKQLADQLDAWSHLVTDRFTSYIGVRQLLATLAEVQKELEPPKGLEEAQSWYYWRSNLRKYCGPLDEGKDALQPPKLQEINRLDAVLTNSLFQYRRAARLLFHAQSARVLSLAPQDGNKRIIVSILAEPGDQSVPAEPQAPGTPDSTKVALLQQRVAELDADSGGRSEAYQFAYDVLPAEAFAATVGYGVPFYKRRGSPKLEAGTLSPTVFVHGRVHTPYPLLRHFGIGLGMDMGVARRTLSGDDPPIPDLMVGAFAWPIEEVTIGTGLAYSPDTSSHVHLGWFFAVTADIPALVRLVGGVQKELAH